MNRTEFASRIAAALDDAAALRAIADELHGIPDSWAGPLRLKAINLSVRAKEPASPAQQGHSPPSPTASLLFPYGLPEPDGRPLYRYRLDTKAYLQLQHDLKQRAPKLRFDITPGDAALFVLWAAEWFRRTYRGGLQRWEDLGKTIGFSRDQQGWRKLADMGLRRWGIAPLRINGIHHRLAALARQGGFPITALDSGRAGWASRYLGTLVGLLLSDPAPTYEVGDGYALGLDGLLPETWRHDEFRAVSVELALAIVMLRRMAEEGGVVSGALASSWLDQQHPGWRDNLPLVIENEAGRALVDGLMRADALKGSHDAVKVVRQLSIDGLRRTERVRFVLDGILSPSVGGLASLPKNLSESWSRLRLFPSGQLARFVTGELGVAEAGDDGKWIVRPTSTRVDFDLPFTIAVEAELRGEGRRVAGPFALANGGERNEGLRVLAAEADIANAGSYEVVGFGSGAYRADPLYIDLPSGWTIRGHDDGTCSSVHGDANSRQIIEIVGSAIASSPQGDKYLLRGGQKAEDRDQLTLIGESPRGCTLADPSVPLFNGAPRFELRSSGRPRSAHGNEAWWRRKGEKQWRPYRDDVSFGLCEFAWRDEGTGHIRDKAEAVILPTDFCVEQERADSRVTVSIKGWRHGIDAVRGERIAPASWRFPAKETAVSHFSAKLADPGYDPIELHIPLPHQAWISHWQQGPVNRNEGLSLSVINQFVARADGRCELLADLIDRNGRPVEEGIASWWVDGELPLSAIHDDVAALLRPLGEIDARVKLNFNDSHENYWYIQEFEYSLVRENRGLIPNRAVVDDNVRIVGRALHAPGQGTFDFGSYGLTAQANHRPIDLPDLTGDWLVYLRSVDRTLSRPLFVSGSLIVAPSSDRLATAMAHQNHVARADAISALCEDIISRPADADVRTVIRQIIDLTVSLDGLPPATFDILNRIASEPGLGPLLLFNAGPSEIAPLMRLADGLPVAWAAVAKRHWDAAAEAQFTFLLDLLPEAMEAIAGAISDQRKAIAAEDLVLAPLLDLRGEKSTLADATQAFLNRSGDRIEEGSTSPFRRDFGAMLPPLKVSDHFARALDAPVAAALAAKERITLSRAHIYCIKDIARRHPRYFREAFAAAFREI